MSMFSNMYVHMVPRCVISGAKGAYDSSGRTLGMKMAVSSGSTPEDDVTAVLWIPQNSGKCRITGFMKQLMIAGIRLYQKYLSPLKTTRCPYIPSCSAYGLEAIQKYGAWKGGWMALWRILRCNPFSHGGYDPVP